MNAQTRSRMRLVVYLLFLLVLSSPALGQCEAPTKLDPARGESGVPLNATLRWLTDQKAEAIHLYVKADSEPDLGRDPFITLAGTALSYTFEKPLLDEKTKYFWAVVYVHRLCVPSPASVVESFITTTCPGNPSNTSPSDGAKVPSKPTLSWTSVGASSYDVLASIDGAVETVIGSTGGSTTSFSSFTFPEGSEVSWRVRARSTNGCGSKLSTATRFTVLKCTSPTNIAPKDGVSGVSPNATLEWSPVEGASLYEIYASINGGPEEYRTKTPGTQTQITHTFPSGATVVWRVKAFSPCGELSSSATKFTVVTCEKPVNVSPRDGETNVPPLPTLEWTAVSGATLYEVYARVNDGAESYIGKTDSTKFTPAAKFPEGATVTWRINAITSNGCGELSSNVTKFTVISCSFDPPEQGSPANGSTQPTTVKFVWKAVTGASDYGLLTSVNGAAPLEVRVGNVTSTEQKFPSGAKVVWFVRAYPSNGCAPVRSTTDFAFETETACPTGSPRLLQPTSGSTVASPVTFKWDAVAGIDFYEIWVAQKGSSEFVSAGKTKETGISLSVSGVVQWYVEAVFPGTCPRGKSEVSKFEVESLVCPREGPALVSPADGASVATPAVFEWGSVPGALKYSLEMRKAGELGPFVEVGTTTATKLEVKLSLGEFEWRVIAYPDKCDAVTSATRRFAVKESLTCGSNRAPDLVYPANGETFKTDLVKFVWTLVPEATAYEVQISLDGGGTWKTLGITKEEGIVASVPSGRNAWRVLAQFSGCPSVASLPRAIEVVVETCELTSPSLVAPAAGATVPSPVSLQWSPVAGVDFYRVFASIDGAPVADVSGAVTGTTFEAALPSGTVVWYVEAVSRKCGSTFSDKGRFQVEARATCPGAGPRLVSPSDGQTGVPRIVTFIWESVQGASAYEVFVLIDGSAPTSLGQTKELSLQREMKGEKIGWFVVAISAGCKPVQSSTAYFALAPDDACSIAAPSRILPGDNTSPVSPVLFQWSGSGEGTYYRLWVTRDGEQEVVLAETLDTTVTRHLVPGSYSWFVEAFRKGCRLSAKSSIGRFAVKETQNCVTKAPTPLTPADGTTLTSPEVAFNWSPVEGAIAYELWLSRGDGVETLVRVTRLTSETLVLGEGKMSWFVRALFEGCPATRSQSNTFAISLPESCKGQPPFILSPPLDEPATLPNPIFFSWSPSTGGSGPASYKVFASINESEPLLIGESFATSLVAELPLGRVTWFVRAERPGCPTEDSSRGVFVVAAAEACGEPRAPAVRAVLEAPSGEPYQIAWLPGANSGSFIVEESADPMFTVVTPSVVTDTFTFFIHDVAEPTAFYYRVFAISSCNDKKSLPSETIKVVVTPKKASGESKVDSIRPLGTTGPVTIPVQIGGASGKSTSATTFTASTTQPWMTVSPSSGTIPPEGLTLTVTADTSQLGPGANTGSLVVTTTDSMTGKTVSSGTTSTPVSVSLVAPVSPTTKSGPKPESLVIPAVGHAAGFNSAWRSDVRLSNLSAQSANYLLFFTPSGQAGTGTIKQASVTVKPGETVALDDVVKSWFGIGADGSSATGSLEIRPQSNAITTSASSSLANGASLVAGTSASSRTYNLSTGGTFGQFIPPVAYSKFAGKGEVLSLQQISQSDQFRTNIGVVEGSGEAATVRFTVLSNSGQQLDQWTEELKPGEQRQYDRLIANRGLTLEGGRVEVEVVSDTGKITAYGSTVDNQTGDPTFSVPVNRKTVEAESKLVIPGVADLDNGIASWRTDVRLFNAGQTSETVTFAYYPQGSTTPSATKQMTVAPGAVLEANDVLKSTFGITNSGGALHITTDGSANIVPTARTYNKTATGTYGQFIPAVSANKGARIGSSPLQLLQVEQSAKFRTNLGLAELSGNATTVEVVATVPGTLTAPIKRYTLGPNEFRQVNAVLTDLGVSEAYNARISIRVVSGAGAVNAYASVVDNATQDPTYVPAQ